MLDIIEYAKDEYAFPSLIVLGCFDAIHAGHRELFKKAKLQAKINGLDLGVMMFRDGKGGRQVYSFEERVAMLAPFNVKFVLVIDFTPEFKEIAPLDFLAAIEDKINVKAYMSGKDFRFGKGAKGKSSTLKNYAEDEDNGVWYMPVKDVMCEGEKISTTLIKRCLEEGDVRRAGRLLGENFYVEGTVVHGARRGAALLGFPTVNIKYPEWKYPVRQGVYKVTVGIDGGTYLGIANFGGRPTFGDEEELLEVHIKDFEGDLYGKTLKVGFVGYMRPVRKFADPAELSAQLAEDKAALGLSEDQFFARYPLEEAAECAAQPQAEQTEGECAPARQVSCGEPAPEAASQQAEEDAAQPAIEQSADIGAASMCEMVAEIPPAWLLLSETVAGEDIPVTPSEPAEGIEEDIAPSEEAGEDAAQIQSADVIEEVVEESAEPQPEEAVEEAAEPQPEEVVEEAAEPQSEEVVEETVEPQPEEAVEETAEPQPEEAVEETAEPQPDEVAEEGLQPLGEEQVEGND